MLLFGFLFDDESIPSYTCFHLCILNSLRPITVTFDVFAQLNVRVCFLWWVAYVLQSTSSCIYPFEKRKIQLWSCFFFLIGRAMIQMRCDAHPKSSHFFPFNYYFSLNASLAMCHITMWVPFYSTLPSLRNLSLFSVMNRGLMV